MFIFAGLMDDVEVGGVEKVQQKYSNSGDNINGQRGNGAERARARERERILFITTMPDNLRGNVVYKHRDCMQPSFE